MTAPSPLTEQVRVTDVALGPDGRIRVSALVTIDPDNPILAGHYPGLPIFPGVCLVECTHRTVLAAVPPGGVPPVLESVRTARFQDTVFPGDEIRIQTEVTTSADAWLVTAVLQGERGLAARISLSYRPPGADP